MRFNDKNRIVMVGPDAIGLGGISRVVKIWKENNLFQKFNICYIGSVSDNAQNKLKYFLSSYIRYIILLLHRTHCIYVHTSSYNSFRRKSIFLIAAIIFRKKIVLHIHPTHFYNYLAEIKSLEKIVVHAILKYIALIVVLTEDMKIKINKFFPNKYICVVPNAVDMKKLTHSNKIKRSSNCFLYLGWYIKEKGVYELVDAIEQLTIKGIGLTAHFYGTKQIDNLKRYVKEKKLERQVSIHDWIDDSMKVAVLHSCTALILPSHSEGIPNVILEAMATKTPIISTQVGGLKEILIDRKNSIITRVGDVEDISSKLELCLNDSELRNQIAENAYKEVKMNYTIDVILAKMKLVFAEIEKISFH